MRIALELAMPSEIVKSQQRKSKQKPEGYIYIACYRKRIVSKIGRRQKTVQSYSKNVQSQRFHDMRTLARISSEAFRVTVSCRNDEQAAKKICTICSSNNFA